MARYLSHGLPIAESLQSWWERAGMKHILEREGITSFLREVIDKPMSTIEDKPNPGCVLLLTYYYDPEDSNHPLLRHVVGRYCPAYLPWDMYMVEPLKERFPRTIVYDYLRRRAELGIRRLSQEVLEIVGRERPKYVVWTSFAFDLQPETFDGIRALGSTIVGWFFDDDWRFDSYSKYCVPFLDFCVTNSSVALPRYEALSARAVHIVPNTGVAVKPWRPIQERCDVSFVGTLAIADRLKFLQFLREGRIPFEVHGEGAGGYVTFDRMLNIFQSSKINLSFSKGGGYYLVRQIKGRVFQVCLAGGFLLTENSPGIDGYFDVGKEIVCFDTPEEMVDKIRYYLEHDGERRAIARAGWERASREYTSSHLVNRAFEEIERRWVGDGWQRRSASKLAMPRLVRRFPADYHLCWAKAYLEEGADDGLWRESRDTSLRWNRLNPWVAYFWFASLFPQPIRRCLCRWQDYEWRTRVRVLRRLQKINLVRVVADRVFRRLW